MSATVKKLNELGIKRFREVLDAGRATGVVRFVTELRDNPEFHAHSFAATVDETQFPTAFSMAEYLTLRLLPLTPEDVEGTSGFGDLGVWSWLTVWFFDVVCPTTQDGTRNVGPDERYIPEVRAEFSFHRYYRHRLAGPYRIYQQHGKHSFPLLHTPVHKHSGLYRAVEEQQDLMQTPSVIEAIGLLYFDAAAKRPKPSAIGSDKAGSLRRFIEVVRQLDLTYDLQALSGEELINLLPDEFSPWRAVIAGATNASHLFRQAVVRLPVRTRKIKTKPLSRQEKWKLSHKNQGLCIMCSEKAINANFCRYHNEQAKRYRRESYGRTKNKNI